MLCCTVFICCCGIRQRPANAQQATDKRWDQMEEVPFSWEISDFLGAMGTSLLQLLFCCQAGQTRAGGCCAVFKAAAEGDGASAFFFLAIHQPALSWEGHEWFCLSRKRSGEGSPSFLTSFVPREEPWLPTLLWGVEGGATVPQCPSQQQQEP